MEHISGYKVQENHESTVNKYGTHFEYNDLCTRLMKVKRKRDMECTIESGINEQLSTFSMRTPQNIPKQNLNDSDNLYDYASQIQIQKLLLSNSQITSVKNNIKEQSQNQSTILQMNFKKHPDFRIKKNKTPVQRNQFQNSKLSNLDTTQPYLSKAGNYKYEDINQSKMMQKKHLKIEVNKLQFIIQTFNSKYLEVIDQQELQASTFYNLEDQTKHQESVLARNF